MTLPQTRTITLGENDAAIIFRDKPEIDGCDVTVDLQPVHAAQVKLPEEKSASYLALLASTPFQQDAVAQLIATLCRRHLSTSAGLDHSPSKEGPIQ